MRTYDVYLAGPFFNDQQKANMKSARLIVQGLGLTVCDPQDLSPVIVDLPEEERKATLFAHIFARNIAGMCASRIILACIDDRDTGTAFEIGYGYAREIPVYTFSAAGHGANVMLAQATKAHCPSLETLAAFFRFSVVGRETAAKLQVTE
jgi:nucleoside 2-deoxyribosyltransferase